MTRFHYIALLTLLRGALLPAQESGFEFFPSGHHISPLIAHASEARIGLIKDFTTQRMKVDIGNSLDVAALRFAGGEATVTFGVDFFAYAFVVGARGLHLQIDAIDGYFGGNCSFSTSATGHRLQARLRILHHSAHLVDGNFDPEEQAWQKPGGPFPFTRDFGELVLAHAFSSDEVAFRYYCGFAYATLVRPDFLRRESFFAGAEAASRLFAPSPGNPGFHLFAAYHRDYIGTPGFRAADHFEGGIKMGAREGKGVRVFFMYRTGRHMFSEYINEDLTFTGGGFTVDFP